MKPFAFSALFMMMAAWLGWTLNAAEADFGKRSYLQYCSSCHGQQGLGNGPVSRYLNVNVPDLSLLKKNNRGNYPMDYVVASIDGRRDVRGHGERQMPVWGEIFRIEQERHAEQSSLQKAQLIAEYVATLQK
jgi:mono/diheme cytochrome c family protein